ncbi:MAG: hypothetical protein VKL59_09095 [Nostocaceae cyanobacterium]|nr:hypothetical protein [Nostocaceae cyanobacterium]
MNKFQGSSIIFTAISQHSVWRYVLLSVSRQPQQDWKNLLFCLTIASSGVSFFCFDLNTGLAAIPNTSNINYLFNRYKLRQQFSGNQNQKVSGKDFVSKNFFTLTELQLQSSPLYFQSEQRAETLLPSDLEYGTLGIEKGTNKLDYPLSNTEYPMTSVRRESHTSSRQENPTDSFLKVEPLDNELSDQSLLSPQGFSFDKSEISNDDTSSQGYVTADLPQQPISETIKKQTSQIPKFGFARFNPSTQQIFALWSDGDTSPLYQERNWKFRETEVTFPVWYSQTPPTTATPGEVSPNPPGGTEAPQLEGQPNILPTPVPPPVQQQLPPPAINGDPELGILKLREQINFNSFPSPREDELGELRVRLMQNELGILSVRPVADELGTVRVRPLETPPSKIPPPPRPTQPVLYLLARSSYFQTNNIFSSVDPIGDGLVWTGLTLAAAPVRLGPQTFINLSADGSIIRYIDQSPFNYNQVRFNLGLYQQLSSRMYGEIGWNNQQLFTAKTGDRFLNENSLRLFLGRRDFFTRRLILDSFYEFRLTLADPTSRSRIINSLWLSLSYYLQSTWQVGLDYQYSLSNFSERNREDQLHRLMGRLTYQTSNNTNITLQGGWSVGGSNEPNIDFDSLFFSVTFGLELGRF